LPKNARNRSRFLKKKIASFFEGAFVNSEKKKKRLTNTLTNNNLYFPPAVSYIKTVFFVCLFVCFRCVLFFFDRSPSCMCRWC
jgi:hypothetical protein